MINVITRQEQVLIKINAKVGKKNIASVRKIAAILDLYCKDKILSGDEIDIDYTFNLNYLNDVDQRFQAIIKLLKTNGVSVTNVNIEAINQQEILIKSMLDEIAKIKIILKAKTEMLPNAKA